MSAALSSPMKAGAMRQPQDIDGIRREIAEAAPQPLARAVTLPKAAYTSEDYFRHEADAVLSSGWLCIAHVSQLKAPGSYIAVDLLDEPLVAVRDETGAVRVLSRICPHRGTDILHECFGKPREGTTRRLTCPYHVWAFDLSGKLVSAPERERAEGFVKGDWSLPTIRSEIWHGFLFVNLDGKASPLAGQYADFGEAIAPWNTEEMEVVIELQWECDFNWKVMIENWMESYHHMGIHHDTLQVTMPARTTWTDPEHPHFIRCHLPFRPELAEELREIAAGTKPWSGFKPVDGLPIDRQTEWGLYLGYPGFMFLTMRDRVLWYRLEPVSASRCRLSTMTLISKEARADPSFDEVIEAETKMLSDFHAQDMQVNQAVQKGLKSAHVVRGRLSHLEEPVWLIQRYLAARLDGRYPERAI
ncbi:aromatic ring-hydroxylating dioxygenase subunit alpha [Parvibaculum sp.]|uniref:aromatic ring-hydroxylating oxygenase subunit alpha n=1 Tax=Parvibaculum sp. TaxID=2024848 RepID=UPI00321094DB